MSDPRDEKKIEELLAEYRLKRPPEDLMKNYVSEVRSKLHPPASHWGLGVTVLVLAGAAAGAFLIWMLRPQAPVTAPVEPVPALMEAQEPVQELAPEPEQAVAPEMTEVAKALTEEQVQEIAGTLADDMFLLEMLGEDEGILDDTNRVETDLEIFAAA